MEALSREISLNSAIVSADTEFDTIYFGGGTPSLMREVELEKILAELHQHFRFSKDVEVTLETNPGTVDIDKLKSFRALGINRLSIGIQSFHDDELKFLGRIHSAQQAKDTIRAARAAGFDNLSLDFIYALPGQDLSRWRETLHAALEFTPEHISAYNLIFEEGTPFYKKLQKGEMRRQPEENEIRFFEWTHSELEQNGFDHYEISNYGCGEENYSRHNYKYWQHVPYLSFGPSAHSYWNGERYGNVRSVLKYIRLLTDGGLPVDFRERPGQPELLTEQIMLQLRTAKGIRLERFEQVNSFRFEQRFAPRIAELCNEGLAVLTPAQFYLTAKGMLLCDEITPTFDSN
jgi:oxygen-independent coproporphyrinogen-3 oxidase